MRRWTSRDSIGVSLSIMPSRRRGSAKVRKEQPRWIDTGGLLVIHSQRQAKSVFGGIKLCGKKLR
jgi:hypothetical protein